MLSVKYHSNFISEAYELRRLIRLCLRAVLVYIHDCAVNSLCGIEYSQVNTVHNETASFASLFQGPSHNMRSIWGEGYPSQRSVHDIYCILCILLEVCTGLTGIITLSDLYMELRSNVW